MSEMVKANQRVPEEFADILRHLYASNPDRLDSLLLAANMNGWTLSALAVPLGLGRERVRQRVAKAEPAVNLPEVPPVPRRDNQMPNPKRRLELKQELIDELLEMQAVARTVNGAMHPENPARRVSEQFSAQIAAYVDQGVTVYYLAQVLGVHHNAIFTRLARHGYRDPAPSLVGTPGEAYRNLHSQHRKATE
jgi:hypothetical protein